MRHLFRSIARLALVLACVFGPHADGARNASAGSISATDRTVVIPIEVASAADAMLGFARTTIAPGGSYRFAAGSSPSFQFVERGSLRLDSAFASLTHVSKMPGTPAGGEGLEAGTAFVVGVGELLDLRNDSQKPAIVLRLLAAADASSTDEFEVSHQVLAQRAYQLPAGVVTLSLRKTELDPGKGFDWPAGTATTAMLAPLDPDDARSITGDGFNRGPFPVAIYALLVTSIRSDVAPPTHPVEAIR